MQTRRSFLRYAGAAMAAPWVLPRAAHSQSAATGTRLTVASFGGQLDEVYRRVFSGFEAEHGVRIDWVAGTAPGNVAKLQATRSAPEYDVILFENVTQRLASSQGLLAPIDPAVVTNYAALTERSRAKASDGAAVGGFVTGLYYRRDAFAQRGWAPPRSWNDMERPELAPVLGLERASQVYTLNAVLMLAGADPARIDAGISRFAAVGKRVRVLEPAAAKHEEKILLGEYLAGVNSTIRALPLTRRLPDLAFVLPEEGAVTSSTMVAPVRNAPNPALAQAFINAFLAPAAQEVLMRELFYSPAHAGVAVPDDLRALGLPDQQTLARMPVIDDDVVVSQRRDWTRKLERELGA
jgi:putative spermidine/putrescine transport system substrate-binding protein